MDLTLEGAMEAPDLTTVIGHLQKWKGIGCVATWEVVRRNAIKNPQNLGRPEKHRRMVTYMAMTGTATMVSARITLLGLVSQNSDVVFLIAF